MIYKILLTIGVVLAIYFIFFKKKSVTSSNTGNKTSHDKIDSDDMVACEACGTYVRVDEALIKNAKYYCSQECMNAKD